MRQIKNELYLLFHSSMFYAAAVGAVVINVVFALVTGRGHELRSLTVGGSFGQMVTGIACCWAVFMRSSQNEYQNALIARGIGKSAYYARKLLIGAAMAVVTYLIEFAVILLFQPKETTGVVQTYFGLGLLTTMSAFGLCAMVTNLVQNQFTVLVVFLVMLDMQFHGIGYDLPVLRDIYPPYIQLRISMALQTNSSVAILAIQSASMGVLYGALSVVLSVARRR